MKKKQIGIRLDEELIKKIDLFVSSSDEIQSRTDFFEKAANNYITNEPQTLADLHSDILKLAMQSQQQYSQLLEQVEIKAQLQEPVKKKRGIFGLFAKD